YFNHLRERRDFSVTWIKTLATDSSPELSRAIAEQNRLYPEEYEIPLHPSADGITSEIVASHSLIPDALYHAFSTFGALLSPAFPLKRRDHELIATVVSVANRCHY